MHNSSVLHWKSASSRLHVAYISSIACRRLYSIDGILEHIEWIIITCDEKGGTWKLTQTRKFEESSLPELG